MISGRFLRKTGSKDKLLLGGRLAVVVRVGDGGIASIQVLVRCAADYAPFAHRMRPLRGPCVNFPLNGSRRTKDRQG
jgi:hypothetical protein